MADAAAALQWDLVPRMSPYLDRHLILALLEHLEDIQLYPIADIRKAKIDLLNGTMMVDFVLDIIKQVDPASAPIAEIDAKRQEVMNTLERLQEEAKPLIELFGQAELYKSLKESGNLNKIAYLTANHNVTEGTVKALYLLGKHLYECGDYTRAHEHLAHFREVSTDSELGLNALWGKLATNILMEQWDVALKDLLAVKEFVDARAFANPTLQLQQRTWLLHWALPIFFNSPEARTTLLEMFHHEKTFQAAQTSCPHLLRYIIVASIVAKRRFPKELIKIVDQEAYVYSDPVTKFIETLYGLTDFEGAEAQLALCGPILDNDPYLHHVKTEFLEASRQLIFELFCKLHSCIDTKILASKLNMTPDESEKWIVNLIRGAKLDAKIDTQANQVLIGSQTPALYQQLIDRTRILIRPLGPAPGPKRHQQGHREGQKENRSAAAASE